MKSMPVSGQSLRSRESLWTRIHVDPWLLLLILALAAVDAFVLYSASGKNLGMVYRQLAYFAVGIAAMIVVAPFSSLASTRTTPPLGNPDAFVIWV